MDCHWYKFLYSNGLPLVEICNQMACHHHKSVAQCNANGRYLYSRGLPWLITTICRNLFFQWICVAFSHLPKGQGHKFDSNMVRSCYTQNFVSRPYMPPTRICEIHHNVTWLLPILWRCVAHKICHLPTRSRSQFWLKHGQKLLHSEFRVRAISPTKVVQIHFILICL